MSKQHIEHDSRVGAHWVDEAGFHYLTEEQLNELTRFHWQLAATSIVCGLVGAALLIVSAIVML